MNDTKSEILIVAAEASSALYAQRLIEHWKIKNDKITFYGIGNLAMENLGFERIGHSETMAVVGIQEVLSHWREIRKVFHQILHEVKVRNTKIALLLDYPDFNLRLAQKLKALGITVIYYISPQLWAWRKGRINIVKKCVDRMLVLFPFEKEFYQTHGVHVDFVGHPLLDELSENLFNETIRQKIRDEHGIKSTDFILGLMPGSRRSELKHHLQIQIEIAQKLEGHMRSFLLLAPGLKKSDVTPLLSSTLSSPKIEILQEDPLKMVQITDLILCASGTATLVVGLMQKPMVIMYRMNTLTAFLAKQLVKSTPYFGMVNLIFNKKTVPEYFQNQATPDFLSQEILKFYTDKDLISKTISELKKLPALLGNQGATQRVASIVNEYLLK